jgi:hypothetical protein
VKISGINKFRDEFLGFEDYYVLIGGSAASVLVDDMGFDFRATHDLDIVLIIEKIDDAFTTKFQEFVNNGGYTPMINESGSDSHFYRFEKPTTPEYPAMLELFARKPIDFELSVLNQKRPIHISDNVPSLSALLLDDEYYQLLKDNMVVINGLSVVTAPALIAFKAKAYLDLNERKSNGERVDSKNIKKHLRDIMIMSQYVEDNIVIPESIQSDMSIFLTKFVEDVDFDPAVRYKGVVLINKAEIVQVLRDLFGV